MIDFNNNIYLGVASPDMERDLSNYYTKAQTRALVDTKQDIITGAASTITDSNLTTNRAVISNGSGKVAVSNVTSTELGYLSGVTSGVQTQLNNKASTSLDNLSSAGQMIVDSQNGTISNCILEIPQNIKLTLENNVLTLASGSVVALTGYNTYTTRTTSSDIVKDGWGSQWHNKRLLIFIGATGTWFGYKDISLTGSGQSLPSDGSTYTTFYLTTDNKLYEWSNNTWTSTTYSYPLCVIDVDSNGVASFAKDSNGNDMIFNGACFVGHHAVVYPNSKIGLIADGLTENNELKSIARSITALVIIELTGATAVGFKRCIHVQTSSYFLGNMNIKEVESLSDLDGSNNFFYVKSENIVCNGQGAISKRLPLIYWTKGNDNIVTDFTIRKPVRLATTEMLDKVQDQVDTNTSNIANKQDIIPSSVYIPQPYITDNTDDNAELDYLLASNGSSAGLSGITTYCSDYIEITGDYIILHDVYAPSDTTYASYVLYNNNKTLIRSFTSSSTNSEVGDVILKSSTGAKYVRFQTNLTTKPTYSVVNQTTSQKQVNNIIEEYPYTNLSLQNGGFDYKVDSSAENGTIKYPNGTNQSSTSSNPRNRSSYIEIPQNGILLTDIFVPTGSTYAAFALYDSNKNAVDVYNRAKLGYQGSGTNIIDKLFIPYNSSYKYVRFQHIDTTSDIIYGIPINIWYSMPKFEGNNKNLLSYDKNGETLWTPAGLVGDKKSLSIGVFGGSFATSYYAQTAYDKWVDKLGVEYTTYAIGGSGFVQGTNNFVVQATNAGIHDIYVIWCSTNDFTHSQPIGDKDDVYGTDSTCWANFKEVVRICYSKNPNAKVCLLTSSPHLTSNQGNEEGRGDVTTYTNTLKEHVEAQKAMCAYYSLPCLDQYNNSQQNGFNYTLVTGGSGFHLTPYGYSLMVNNQIDFLSKL